MQPQTCRETYTESASCFLSFFDSVLQLIVRTSTDLPPDVRAAMQRRRGRAGRHPRRAGADDHRAEHRSGRRSAKARSARTPACRPSRCTCRSAPTRSGCASRFARRWPRRRGAASCGRTRSIRSPARTPATTSAPARRSSTSISGSATTIEIKLILKGGGCENTNAQYALPVELPHLGRADRTLDGVRKCILHAVWNAQGKGCSPGAVGVCIGGDRTSGLPPREGTAVPDARRRESRIRGWRSSKRRSWRRSTSSRSARWASAATSR